MMKGVFLRWFVLVMRLLICCLPEAQSHMIHVHSHCIMDAIPKMRECSPYLPTLRDGFTTPPEYCCNHTKISSCIQTVMVARNCDGADIAVVMDVINVQDFALCDTKYRCSVGSVKQGHLFWIKVLVSLFVNAVVVSYLVRVKSR